MEELTNLIDWLNQQNGAALVSDDNGHWAVSWDGMCPVTATKHARHVTIAVDVCDPAFWQDSIIDALRYAHARHAGYWIAPNTPDNQPSI